MIYIRHHDSSWLDKRDEKLAEASRKEGESTYGTAITNPNTNVAARAPIIRSEGPGRLAAGNEER